MSAIGAYYTHFIFLKNLAEHGYRFQKVGEEITINDNSNFKSRHFSR